MDAATTDQATTLSAYATVRNLPCDRSESGLAPSTIDWHLRSLSPYESEGLAYRQVPGITIRRTAVVEAHDDALFLLNRELQSSTIARDDILIA